MPIDDDHPHHDDQAEPDAVSAGGPRLPPRWWQSLRELEPGGATARADELPDGAPIAIGMAAAGGPGSRRDFFKVMGLSATAAMAACSRPPEQKILPFTTKPDELIPGVASWYATACGGCAAGCGLLVKTRDGRPIKVEGNASHPVSRGAVCAVGQASVLGLYDADRARGPRVNGHAASWATVDQAVRAGLAKAAAAGRAVRLVVPWGLGPTEEDALGRLCAVAGGQPAGGAAGAPAAKLVRFDPMGQRDAIAETHRILYGAAVVPDYRLDDAELIVGVGADFLGTWLAPAILGRQYATARDVDRRGRMARHVQFEAHLTITGSAADERYPVPPSSFVPVLATLVGQLASGSAAPAVATARAVLAAVAPAAPGAVPAEALAALAGELRRAGPHGVVLCGSDDPRAQLLAALANALLGNQGTTAVIPPGPAHELPELTFAALRDELVARQVGALIFVGTNPLLVERALGETLGAVELTVSTSERLDETASLCGVHAPEGHALEAWLDHAPRAGVETMGQPCVAPLFDTRARLASALSWAGDTTDAFAFFKARWERGPLAEHAATADASSSASAQAAWDNVVREGFHVSAVDEGLAPPALRPAADLTAELAALATRAPGTAAGELELVLHESVALRDGAPANNGWLQELPDPITKQAWGNAAAIGPAHARALGLEDGDVVELGTGGETVRVPIVVQPGTAPGVVALAVGHGRTSAGHMAKGHGADAWPLALRTAYGLRRAGLRVALTATGMKQPLALTQTHASQEGRELVRHVSLAEALAPPVAGSEPGGPKAASVPGAAHPKERGGNGLWPGHVYAGHRWALSVDLNKCTGCAACIVSCNAENNIPVVGELEVRRRREMHWLRIDRYYGGTPENPEVVHQPMMCQHCENAPCETVCPVLATVHSSEGLNQQIYNRCVGTRYCANNCPTKVRRFNWFDYRHGDDLSRMVLNPDVVVRSRGVMEKCSLCVQRIEEARALSRREGRTLADGDIKTACQQSCPAEAITFGDSNDPASAVARLTSKGRAYHILEEINVKPQVAYLARVKSGGRDG